MKMMKDEWFPFVTKNIKAKHGWETFYYGNVVDAGRARPRPRPRRRRAATAPAAAAAHLRSRTGAAREWRTFEHVPRFHNSYVGMRNRFALLSEAYAYATFEDRIKATNYFMEEALNFAHQNAARIKKAVADADREKLVGTTLATSARIKRGGMIEILMGEVEIEKNPVSGADMNRRKDVVKPEQMVDMLWFEPVTTETAPAAYYVPADRDQGGRAPEGARHPDERDDARRDAEAAGALRDDRQHRRPELRRACDAPARGEVARGTFDGFETSVRYWEVRMDQPLGAARVLSDRAASDDGLVAWNYLDGELKDAVPRLYPILRRK